MNIGQPYYPILTPQQANPMASALARTIQQHLANMQTQASTKSIDLQNQLSNKLLPYAAPKAQAELTGLQLQNKSTDLGNQRTASLLPYAVPDARATLESAQLDNSGKSLQNKLAELLMPSQVEAGTIDNALKQAQTNYYKNGGARGGAGVDANRINAIKSQLAIDNPNWNDAQINDAANQYLLGNTTFSDGTPLPKMGGIVSDLVDMSNLKTNTTMGNNQQRYAATLETAFNAAEPLANSAFKYAGSGGQAKLAADKLAAQTGSISPDYANYLKFTRVTIPALASEILRTGGANSTDSQKLLAIQQANPITYDNNSELAKIQWDFLTDLYRKIGKTLAQSVTQTRAQLRKGASRSDYSSSSNNDYSNDAMGSDPLGFR